MVDGAVYLKSRSCEQYVRETSADSEKEDMDISEETKGDSDDEDLLF